MFPEDILSSSRFGTYLQATGHDRDRALDLYGWNLRMGAAFMPVLCAAEIALRNRISHHEPIFPRNQTQDHRDLIELVHWLSKPKGRWMLRQSNVMAILRGRP